MAADRSSQDKLSGRGSAGVNPVSGRLESEQERLDRNYSELLQELRVAQTGTQILLAFLLAASFTEVVQRADPFTHRLLAVTTVLSASAAALLIAPVALHRLVFHRRLKATLVRVASRLAQGGLAVLLLAMLGATTLCLDAVLSREVALGTAAVVGLWFVGWWYVLPLLIRSRHGRDAPPAIRGAG